MSIDDVIREEIGGEDKIVGYKVMSLDQREAVTAGALKNWFDQERVVDNEYAAGRLIVSKSPTGELQLQSTYKFRSSTLWADFEYEPAHEANVRKIMAIVAQRDQGLSQSDAKEGSSRQQDTSTRADNSNLCPCYVR